MLSISGQSGLLIKSQIWDQNAEMQCLQKGPEFWTWSRSGPNQENGPEKVQKSTPTPEFLDRKGKSPKMVQKGSRSCRKSPEFSH